MAFKNRIRLPIYVTTPQFPIEANRFRKANGATVTQSVVIRKTYNLITDYLSERLHQRLVMALNHDEVTVENDKYFGDISVDGKYEITWPEFLDYPLGQGSAVLEVTPFNYTNSNCQTCEQVSQLSLVDDTIPEPLAEGVPTEVNVIANDSICCFPIQIEVVSFNESYLSDATVNDSGVMTLTALNPAPAGTGILLATYRVSCPDGSYDEADVYGDIDGSEPGCDPPTDIFTLDPLPPPPFDYTFEWNAPAIPPAGGYEWILFRADTPGVPVDSGSTMGLSDIVTAPDPDTDYIFFIRSVCGEGLYSDYVQYPFTTIFSGAENCGSFNLYADDGTVFLNMYSYSYMNCSGIIVNALIQNLQTQTLCMLMDEDNNPYYFESAGGFVNVTYVEPC